MVSFYDGSSQPVLAKPFALAGPTSEVSWDQTASSTAAHADAAAVVRSSQIPDPVVMELRQEISRLSIQLQATHSSHEGLRRFVMEHFVNHDQKVPSSMFLRSDLHDTNIPATSRNNPQVMDGGKSMLPTESNSEDKQRKNVSQPGHGSGETALERPAGEVPLIRVIDNPSTSHPTMNGSHRGVGNVHGENKPILRSD